MRRFNKPKYRIAFTVFCTLLVTIFCFGVTAAAVNYDNLGTDVLEHIKVRTGLRNGIRSAQFGVLKMIAMVVDQFDEAIDVIMHLNLYDLLDGKFGWDLQPLAWAVLSLFVIIAGLTLMIFADKLKVSDTLRHIIISATIIVAMPTLISALQDLRDKGVDSVDALSSDINQVDDDGLVYGLGDTLLSKNIIAITATENLHYYSEVTDRYPNSIYHININECLDNTEWDKEPVGIDSIDGSQTRYSELTTLNMMDLLDMRSDYIVYTQALANGYDIIVAEGRYSLEDGSVREPDYIQDGQPHWNEQTLKADDYKKYIIAKIANNPYVVDAGLTSVVKAKNTIDEALEAIKDTVIRQLNIQHNKYYAAHGTSTDYFYRDLITQNDYENMAWYNQLITQLKTLGYPSEYIYAYDMNFCFTLFILIITAICLLFAGFKLSTMLYDILFMSLIGSVAAATDTTGAGRSKKIVMELISSYTIFIVVAFVLKLYLISVTGIYNHIGNIIAQILLLIGGAKFVIDGPDVVVKLLGIDAGVKSGAATLTAMHSAASMVQNVGRTVGRTASKAGTTALAAPSKIASVAGSMSATAKDVRNADSLSGKVGAAVGNTPVGQAFKQSELNHTRTNSEYADIKAGQSEGSSLPKAFGASVASVPNGLDALKQVPRSFGDYKKKVQDANGGKATTAAIVSPLGKAIGKPFKYFGSEFASGYNEKRSAAVDSNVPAANSFVDDKNGKDGKDGKDGADGRDGIDGVNGNDGTSVSYKEVTDTSSEKAAADRPDLPVGKGFDDVAYRHNGAEKPISDADHNKGHDISIDDAETVSSKSKGSGFVESENKRESLDSFADVMREQENRENFSNRQRQEEKAETFSETQKSEENIKEGNN